MFNLQYSKAGKDTKKAGLPAIMYLPPFPTASLNNAMSAGHILHFGKLVGPIK